MNIPQNWEGKPLQAQWTYHSNTGKPLGIVGRYQIGSDKKAIVPFFKRNGTGWKAGIDIKPRPLYGLEKLAKHSKNEVVFIVEGEKAAAALQSIGLTALTSIGGSKAANNADWSPLSGYQNVILWPDNDESGRQYAQDVYNCLQSLEQPPEVKLLQPDELPPSGDCVDWLQNHSPDWDGLEPFPVSDKSWAVSELNTLHKKAEPVPDDWDLASKEKIDDDQPLTHSYPEFNDNDFYGIAGEVATLATEDSEADPIAVYLSFLASTAALIGRNACVYVGETKHSARLFTALVGNSSRARKGTSLKPVKRIILKAEEVFLKRSKDTEYSSLHFADGGLSTAEGLIFAVRDESEEVDKKGDPTWDAVDDKRLLVVEEELANVLKIVQREGNTLSPMLRRGWDGGTLAPITKQNKLKSTDPHINVLSHITQFELKILFSQSDRHNGFGNRFLWACVRRPKKVAFPRPMDDDKVYQLAITLSALIEKSTIEREFTMTKEAQKYWQTIYQQVSTDETGLKAVLTARSEAYIIRLALLFALLDTAEEIDVQHLQAAYALVSYCNDSVAYLFTSPADDVNDDAKKLLDALAKGPLTQTGVSNVFNRHKGKKYLKTLLDELQSMNKIKQTKTPGSKKVIWELVK